MLAFALKRWYHTFVVLCLDLFWLYLWFYEGGAAQWQNANFVTKRLLSASRFLTHTDVQTEHGNPTLRELRQSLTALPAEFMLAHAACAPVRLPALSKWIKSQSNSAPKFHFGALLFIFMFYIKTNPKIV